MRLFLLLLAILSGCSSTGSTSDWSRFRGPNGTGLADAEGLPVEFGPQQNVAWRTPLPIGHSSPVLFGSRVYVTGCGEGFVATFALDRASGEVLWRRDVHPERAAKLDHRNNAASATPAVSVNAIVVFFEDVGLIAYDHDGEERWRLPLGPFDNVYGMGASPILHDGRVFLPCDQNRGSFLVAVDERTGEVLWRKERPWATSGHCTPIVHRPEGEGPQLLLPGSFSLDAYDMATGERVWWVDGLAAEMKSTPVLLDGVLYINGFTSPLNQPGQQVVLPAFDEAIAEHDADGDGHISQEEMPPSKAAGFFTFIDLDASGGLDEAEWRYFVAVLASQNGMLAMRVGGRGDMTAENMLWSYRRSVPQLPSPLVVGDVLYMLNDQSGLITTLRPDTGERIERGRLVNAVDNYYASPVAGDGKVFLLSESGIVTVLGTGGSLEPLATNALDEPCYATPAIDGGDLYVRTSESLYCFSKEE